MAAENNIVGEVGLKVVPVDPGFDAGVKKIIDRLEAQAKLKVGADTSAAGQAVDKLSKDIENKLGGAWVQAAAQAAAFTAAIYGSKAAVEAVINKFSQLFDGLAKARAGFNSILGDKAGGVLLNQVRQFAIDSPFVTSELVQYSQQLLGVGKAAATIVPTLKNVGDIVASVGGDTSQLGSILYALTQIQTIGKLTGQDARQLQNQLVPITRYIAEYTKQSVADVKKLQEAGGISSDIVFAAIANQGKKVEGALNASVRTIAGAKSVLSDTVTALLQNNVGLQGIFDDIVKGIQSLATAIGKPENLKFINDAINSVVGVYEQLKPVVAGFLQFAGQAGTGGLAVFGRVLETLANVLDAFPVSFLKIIGQALGVLATLKAPLALLKYADSIRLTATGLLGVGPALNKVTAGLTTNATANTTAAVAATQANSAYSKLSAEFIAVAESAAAATAAIDNVGVATQKTGLKARAAQGLKSTFGTGFTPSGSKLGLGVSVAAGLAGSVLQGADSTNGAAQAAGGALTYGAIGAQVAGPYGAAIGAAFGAITGYLDSQDAILEKQIAKNRELGKKAAEAYLRETAEIYRTATPQAAQFALDEITKTQAAIQAAKDAIPKDVYKATTPDGNIVDRATSRLFGSTGSDEQRLKGERDKQIALLQDTLTVQQEKLATFAQPILNAVKATRDAGVGKDFLKQSTSPASVGSDPVKSFKELDVAFRAYGVTTQDVINLGSEAFTALVTQIDGLDTAQKKAVVSANTLALAYKDSAAASAALYGNQIAEISNKLSALNAVEQAKAAAISAAQPGGSAVQKEIAALTSEQATKQAQQTARAVAYADSIVASEEAIKQAKQANNDVLAASLAAQEKEVAEAAAVVAEQRVLSEVYDAVTAALRGQNAETERYLGNLSLAQTAANQVYRPLIQVAQAQASFINTLSSGSSSIAAVLTDTATASELAALEVTALTVAQSQFTAAMTASKNENLAYAQGEEIANVIREAAKINIGNLTDSVLGLNSQLDSVSGKQAVATVIINGVAQAIEQIGLLQTALASLGVGTKFSKYTNEEQNTARREIAKQKHIIDILTGKVPDDKNVLAGISVGAQAIIQPQLDAEAAKNAKSAGDTAGKAADAIQTAIEALTSKLSQSANDIAAAAQKWVTSIKERTQYEQSLSASRLTNNTDRQSKDLIELTAGLANLRGRGVSQPVLDALGIDNIGDTRQVRKLVNSSDADLAKLAEAVANRDNLAQNLAVSEEDRRTRANITQAIIDAAKTLNIDLSKEGAAQISNQFNITPSSNADEIAAQILSILSGGRIGR